MALKECKKVKFVIKEAWKELNDTTLANECMEMLRTNSNGHVKRKKELSIDLGFSASNSWITILVVIPRTTMSRRLQLQQRCQEGCNSGCDFVQENIKKQQRRLQFGLV